MFTFTIETRDTALERFYNFKIHSVLLDTVNPVEENNEFFTIEVINPCWEAVYEKIKVDDMFNFFRRATEEVQVLTLLRDDVSIKYLDPDETDICGP